MVSSMEVLKALLYAEEPEYDKIKEILTEEDIPLLAAMVDDPNLSIATKALSCLGLIPSSASLEVLRKAAKYSNPTIRVAAIAAMKNFSMIAGSSEILEYALNDENAGVKKFALKSIEYGNYQSLAQNLIDYYHKEDNASLKAISASVIKKFGKEWTDPM